MTQLSFSELAPRPAGPNPTLVIGGPGSGKTDAVLARLAALYRADPFTDAVALVPTVRHGDQFRRRLVAQCGVALGLRVETISRFSHGLASEARVPSHALVEELLVRTIRQQVEAGSAAYFKSILGTKGLARLVRKAVGDLLAEGVKAQDMLESAPRSGSESLVALSAIYGTYSTELEQRNWVHPIQIGVAATGAVRAGVSLPSTIVLDGFHLFRGTELGLLEALVERADVAITLDPRAGSRSQYDYERLLSMFPRAEVVELHSDGGPASPSIVAGEAADREAQLRAIARQIKQRLTDEPSLRPSDFAVAFRQASPYLSLARQVFTEYDLPLDPAAGERLNSRPLGVWLRRLLHLAQDGWRLRDLVAVLSSGFIDIGRWGLSKGDVDRLVRHARENHLWSGTEALLRAVEGIQAESERDETTEERCDALRWTSSGMADLLEELRALLDQPSGSTAEHARRIYSGPKHS